MCTFTSPSRLGETTLGRGGGGKVPGEGTANDDDGPGSSRISFMFYLQKECLVPRVRFMSQVNKRVPALVYPLTRSAGHVFS